MLLLMLVSFNAAAECLFLQSQDNIDQETRVGYVCPSVEDSNAALYILCTESGRLVVGFDGLDYIGTGSIGAYSVSHVPTQLRGDQDRRARRYYPNANNGGTGFTFGDPRRIIETLMDSSIVYIRYLDFRQVSTDLTFEVDTPQFQNLTCL